MPADRTSTRPLVARTIERLRNGLPPTEGALLTSARNPLFEEMIQALLSRTEIERALA